MGTSADLELADQLEREIDSRSQAGADGVPTAEEQDWLNTARLAIGPLRSGTASDDERDAARGALDHTPPPRA